MPCHGLYWDIYSFWQDIIALPYTLHAVSWIILGYIFILASVFTSYQLYPAHAQPVVVRARLHFRGAPFASDRLLTGGGCCPHRITGLLRLSARFGYVIPAHAQPVVRARLHFRGGTIPQR